MKGREKSFLYLSTDEAEYGKDFKSKGVQRLPGVGEGGGFGFTIGSGCMYVCM